MTWPSADVNTTNADAGTDSPATFRTDVLDLLTKFNQMRNHVSAFMQGLLSSASASAARTTLGLEGFSARNRIINGDFAINQRVTVGAPNLVLAAGAYGKDRWKAGASGCTYSEATSGGLTTLTISAGSLQQVIEADNLPSGTNNMVLSWSGSAQGKIGAGAYGASGVTASVVGGSNLTVEFGTGTLTLVQLEQGQTPSPFELLPKGLQLLLCQRFYYRLSEFSARACATTFFNATFELPVKMRASPTCTITGVTGTTSVSVSSTSGNKQDRIVLACAAGTAADTFISSSSTSQYLECNAEL